MNCLEFEEDLHDYVDGTLQGAAAARFDVHLRGCANCRVMIADLQTLRAATLSLEPQVPAPHVGARIAAAVGAETRRWSIRRLFGVAGLSWQPVLSSAVVIAVLAGGIWMSWRDVSDGTRPVATSARNAPAAISPIQPAEVELQATERHYTNAIATLEQITQSEGTTLDRPTAAVMQENLAVIDRAIGESRQALQKEPSNDLAQESLFEALRSKITLLQDTIALINEMRKGNQEGAARIVSGMNQ
jgi:hypothetical protein